MAQNNRMQGVQETFDVFGNKVGGTSVKVHHAPGGASSFSLGGGYGDDNPPARRQQAVPQPEEDKQQMHAQAAAAQSTNNQQAAAAGSAGGGAVPGSAPMQGVAETFDVFGNKVGGTSVRVHAPPGGKSSITF